MEPLRVVRSLSFSIIPAAPSAPQAPTAIPIMRRVMRATTAVSLNGAPSESLSNPLRQRMETDHARVALDFSTT